VRTRAYEFLKNWPQGREIESRQVLKSFSKKNVTYAMKTFLLSGWLFAKRTERNVRQHWRALLLQLRKHCEKILNISNVQEKVYTRLNLVLIYLPTRAHTILLTNLQEKQLCVPIL
jgi:hypothetical protein